jgi:hypothetical protein
MSLKEKELWPLLGGDHRPLSLFIGLRGTRRAPVTVDVLS